MVHFTGGRERLPFAFEGSPRLMRILLAAMSNMLGGIVRAALDQSPGIVIPGTADEYDNLAAQVAAAQADAVIMQVAEPGDFEAFRPLLMSFPLLKIIGI